MDSRQRALDAVKPHGRTGVELGPLNRPLIHRADGDILYADHLSTEDLRRKYGGHPTVEVHRATPIVEVDLVLADRTLREALGEREPLDYIVASHVVEHIADPIGWLNACADALREDGLLFLAVPDKRFTFDYWRYPSATGELIGRHFDGATVASPAQVFEHFARAADVSIVEVWAGSRRPPPLIAGHGPALGLVQARAVNETGAYRDVHCSVFTPFSFAQVVGELIALDFIPFEFADLVPTRRNHIEFFALLRKRGAASPAERAAATPRLDPAAHHEFPKPKRLSWRARIGLAIRLLRTGRLRRPPPEHD